MKRNIALILPFCLAFSMAACSVNITIDSGERQKQETEAKEAVTKEAGTKASETADAGEEQIKIAEAEEIFETPELFHPLVTMNLETGRQPGTGRLIYETGYPEVHASESEGGLYPELNASLFADMKTLKESVLGARDILAADAGEAVLSSEYYYSCLHMIDAKVMRADSAVTSIMHNYYGYYGGAHGEYSSIGINYSTKDGKLLAAADIFTDKDMLIGILKERLSADYPDTDFFDLDEVFKSYSFSAGPGEPGVAQFSFGLNSDGAVFWFDSDEIAPYPSGIQTVMLSYGDHPGLFKKKYTVCADSAAEPLDEGVMFHTSGGRIKAGTRQGEDGAIDSITVYVNGREEEFATSAQKADFYLLKNGERAYIYAFEEDDEGGRFLQVFDVNGDSASLAGQSENWPYTEHGIDSSDAPEGIDASLERITTYVMTDTKSFLLDGRDGVAEYCLGSGGMPEKH